MPDNGQILFPQLPDRIAGLGFLAGDFLKECSDLNIPVAAVGFMYPEGYLLQRMREDGWQESVEDPFEREAAAITRGMAPEGRQLVFAVLLIRPPIYMAVWKIAVGVNTLYLMDTDIDENDPWNRAISARLYSGDLEQRLRQEIVLGIGGTEILQRLDIRYRLVHLNEGHAAFTLLERIRDELQKGLTFEAAREAVRRTTVFTTHTPVPAGHDVFPFQLMERYFASYWTDLGLDREQFFKLGSRPRKDGEGFNMTVRALNLSDQCNAVSRRHGEVSREMWRDLWPEKPVEEVPIGSITNGVHLRTWLEPKILRLLDRYLGSGWLEDHDNPADEPGKRILQKVFNICRDPEVGGRIAFVEDYGEQIAQYLVHVVDVWLNNPLLPMEASGMKAALNGVPPLSLLDGWWIEASNGRNSWAVRAASEGEDRDARDADGLYQVLETDIIPLYYRMADDGIPHGWVQVMKDAICGNAGRFSARRMVKEYVRHYYAKVLTEA